MVETTKRGMTAEKMGIDAEDMENWDRPRDYGHVRYHRGNPKWSRA